jgi:hypothetical protein
LPEPQFSSPSPSSPFLDFNLSSPYGPNGFDFGLSDAKTGLGYGVLGDLKSLQAAASARDCDDCPPEEPCPSCSGAQSADGDGQGQIIKAQFPIPLPGMIPPPYLPPTTPASPGSIIIGDPNAWWNWTPGDVADHIRGVFEARPASNAVQRICDEQQHADYRECIDISRHATASAGPEAGARELESCRQHSEQKYSDCLKKKGKPDMQAYPDWYRTD